MFISKHGRAHSGNGFKAFGRDQRWRFELDPVTNRCDFSGYCASYASHRRATKRLTQLNSTGLSVTQWIVNPPSDLQGPFFREFEPRPRRLGLTDGLKA
ncbi:hypothetical protein PoB_002639300 [Plakobranchus ocellatus]|uniref:Uncharacterized protein n=1 Tax=Plakobranchus ocellatus TaxID=259542 RepID=A0AAV3ZYC1_9GAST|nr:hypothetical protein PoB_002639300 [Plakobranchus ocellatus]